jgi:TolA-binding protein
LLGFAALALAAAALFAFFRHDEPLRFVVGTAKAPGELGVWISAPVREPTMLGFSDGSRISMSAGAQARVLSTTDHGARVVIERGTVRADVVPRSQNDWWVVGGPFEIHVTGTSFDTSWEPERQVLRVTMFEGHVDVRGGCLPHTRALSKGESATISCLPPANGASPPSAVAAPPAVKTVVVASSAAEIAPAATAVSAASSTRETARVLPSNAAPPNVASSASRPSMTAISGVERTSERPSAGTPSWRAWARLGSYPEALAAAESEGFDRLCATLSLGDLLELATTARLAGKTSRAGEAYTAVRSRFGGSDGAASAAFHLGQIAFDVDRSYADAHRWFTTYLSERPAGALAAEALGRTMEAEQRMGDFVAARSTAGQYLQRYPTGAHARLARSLLGP